MHIPYIGITDFMSKKQVQKMLKVFKTHKPKNKEVLLFMLE